MQDTKLNMLLAYLARGWALVPLHDVGGVVGGPCSCLLGAECTSAGKHPRFKRWQEPGNLVREATQLATLHAGVPHWNWGVATGAVSGIWALDIDPASGGWDALRALEQEVGALPPTLTLATGGGGRHLIFALPRGEEVHGSQTKNRYGLQPGLDVRGWHGQIVVAPSVSAKGPYGWIADLPVVRAPAAFEAKLRAGRTQTEAGLQPQDQKYSSTELPVLPIVETGSEEGRRRQVYAQVAVGSLIGELKAAPVGTRNDTAFRVACRLIELVNADWAHLQAHIVLDAWWEAGKAHPDGAYVPVSELDGVWRRAQARVGDKAAEPPGEGGWHFGGEIIPFSSVSTGDASVSGGEQRPVAPADDPVQALIDRMLTPEQLRAMPPPEPLINGLLSLDSCAWLIGPPGCYKSFVALDFAAHVGRGEAWRGHAVRQGLAIIIAAEGSRGMRLRVDAWEREYGPLKDVRVLPEPVQADERRPPTAGAAWSTLVQAAGRLRPALIIIDTQARVTIGLNENDNGEMGYYAAQADRLRRATGACVLTVHHTGRNGTNARGASAIDGAQDAELRVERTSPLHVTLHVDKQKDQAEEGPTTLRLARSDGGLDATTGGDLSSLVLVHSEDPFSDPGTPVNHAQARCIALYKLLFEHGNPGDGLTRADLRTLFMALPEITALQPRSRNKAWHRAWNGDSGFDGLVPRGLIAKRAGAERFKIIVLPDQTDEGCLTRNSRDSGTPPAAGWNTYLPDAE